MGTNAVVRAVELTQSIQSIDNEVRLIADKATVMRVYLDPGKVPRGVPLSGEVIWRRIGSGMSYLPSMNRIQFGHEDPKLFEQRFDVKMSLNFILPADAIGSGRLEVALGRVFVPGGDDITDAKSSMLEFVFETAPVLRVRVVGLRYRRSSEGADMVSPDAVHFAYMKSYLNRAYPIGRMDWSQIVIDVDRLRPPFSEDASDVANAYLTMIRTQDIAGGVHPRTHYYGLVDNNRGVKNHTMRGSAVFNRSTNRFEFVASGPAGRPQGWSGDDDCSFADWYSAHELGHTFQRRHPGFPNRPPNQGGQSRDPDDLPGFPYPNGLISDSDNRFVGFDVGDPALGLPMRALRGDLHHDFMTYDDNQWICKYTYDGIFEQLVKEERLYGA